MCSRALSEEFIGATLDPRPIEPVGASRRTGHISKGSGLSDHSPIFMPIQRLSGPLDALLREARHVVSPVLAYLFLLAD